MMALETFVNEPVKGIVNTAIVLNNDNTVFIRTQDSMGNSDEESVVWLSNSVALEIAKYLIEIIEE